jgi:hypothetical protein
MSDVKTTIMLNDGNVEVHSYQDVEEIIEHNKRIAGKQNGDFRHTATIPNNVLLQWLNEEYARGNVDIRWGSPEFDALIKKKLQDRDWLFLRVDK